MIASARARAIVAFVTGLVFAGGLGLSGMTKPAKVEAFLDVTGSGGAWDPSLMFVMIGAIGVYAVAAAIAKRRATPMFAPSFVWPTAIGIDTKLLGGAALFGMGWGLSGYCPGPAIVSIGSLGFETIAFVATLGAAMIVTRKVVAARAARAAAE